PTTAYILARSARPETVWWHAKSLGDGDVGRRRTVPLWPVEEAACLGAEGSIMRTPVSHFEIYADDPGALAKFYTSLFDWKIEAPPGMEGYLLVRTRDVDGK